MASEASDRLVGLFLQSALAEPGDDPNATPELPADGKFTAEAIERGVLACKTMLNGEDGIRMGAQAAPTFVCLGMALEEKPQLQWAAARCYEEGLSSLPARNGHGSWERAVVLQQLGAVCLRYGRYEDAKAWFADCASEAACCSGHPRDAKLFNGAFTTQSTRLEFQATIETMRAQSFHKMGDMVQAHAHLAEAKRLDALTKGGDAVERASPQPVAAESGRSIKDLWAADAGEETRLKRYRYTDEGPTVLVILDLNDHLGLGDEASELVDCLQQFRVHCKEDSVDIRLRVWQKGRAREFRLLLHPLAKAIVPEDTVPRLRGKDAKRRLEVKLFKREKSHEWLGDLVRSGPPMPKLPDPEELKANASKAPAPRKKFPQAPKGTALNPLTPEELAKLPRPSDMGADNRPSNFRSGGYAPESTPSPSPVPVAVAAPAPAPAVAPPASAGAALEEMD